MIPLLLACAGDPAQPAVVVDSPATESRADSGVEELQGCSTSDRVAIGGDTCVLEASCTWSGSMSRAYFGNSLASGQDVDGDGVDDLLIGAPGTTVQGDTTTLSAAGRAVLMSGAAAMADGELGPELLGSEVNGYIGSSVAFLGDVDGDGTNDMAIGEMGATVGTLESAGQVHLVLGGPADSLLPAATWTGGDAFGRGGWTVTGADIDGDGLSEVFVTDGIHDEDGDYRDGRVHIWSGGAQSSAPLADATVVAGLYTNEGFGQALASGDFDGDGVDEVAVSAPHANSYLGRIAIIGQDRTSVPVLGGLETYELPGWTLAAGDLDGDGADELIVGAPLNDSADNAAGQVRVYAGGPGFQEGPTLIASFNGEFHDFQLGSGLGVGDIDGDGDDELLMGSVNSY